MIGQVGPRICSSTSSGARPSRSRPSLFRARASPDEWQVVPRGTVSEAGAAIGVPDAPGPSACTCHNESLTPDSVALHDRVQIGKLVAHDVAVLRHGAAERARAALGC